MGQAFDDPVAPVLALEHAEVEERLRQEIETTPSGFLCSAPRLLATSEKRLAIARRRQHARPVHLDLLRDLQQLMVATALSYEGHADSMLADVS